MGQCGSVVGAERGVEGVLRWVEGEGKANGVMMGGDRKRGRGRRSDLYRSGRGCGAGGAGMRIDTGTKVGARMLQKRSQNWDRLSDPRTLPRSCSRCVPNILF